MTTLNKEASTMSIYRNKNWRGRNYACTNLVACEVLRPSEGTCLDNPVKLDQSIWVYDPNYPIDKLTSLYIEAGIRYYGYL